MEHYLNCQTDEGQVYSIKEEVSSLAGTRTNEEGSFESVLGCAVSSASLLEDNTRTGFFLLAFA